MNVESVMTNEPVFIGNGRVTTRSPRRRLSPDRLYRNRGPERGTARGAATRGDGRATDSTVLIREKLVQGKN